MGSDSDWETMQHAVDVLQQFGVAHEARVVSAHRMPDEMFAYAESAARARPARDHRRRRRRRPPSRHARRQDHRAGARGAGASRHLQGVDSLLQHRADAQGHAGGDLCHRRGRRGQRRRCSRSPCSPSATRRCGAARRFSRPPDRRPRAELDRAAEPLAVSPLRGGGRLRRSATLGRSGRRPAWPHVHPRRRSAWATSRWCSIPTPTVPRAA